MRGDTGVRARACKRSSRRAGRWQWMWGGNVALCNLPPDLPEGIYRSLRSSSYLRRMQQRGMPHASRELVSRALPTARSGRSRLFVDRDDVDPTCGTFECSDAFQIALFEMSMHRDFSRCNRMVSLTKRKEKEEDCFAKE